jgi:hypothetical protein
MANISPVSWQSVSSAFSADGALRDIHVLDTTLEDWQRFWRWLLAGGIKTTFNVDAVRSSAPDDVQYAFRLRPAQSPCCLLDWYGIELACHFFCAEEIEFDLVPSEVTAATWPYLLQFLVQVGDLLGKPIRLTDENAREAVIVAYDPCTNTFLQHSRTSSAGAA